MSETIDERYRVLKALGAGSMGVVYLAEDVFLGRPVAIKVIDPVHASHPASHERFVKEARALAQIRHQNVVQVYAFGPHQKSFYFAMEYVEGDNLEVSIDAGETVDVARAIEILRAVADGLDAVHARKLVHRDVKPSNIVIEKGTLRPVLIDFGLARRRSTSSPRVSIAAGTPSYMAPEQATDPEGTRVTFRADIYALACTGFEILTGRMLFDGKDIFEVMLHHMKTPAPKLSSRRPDLAPLDAAFERALSKEPTARHESAKAFVAELELALTEHEKTTRRDTIGPPSERTAAATPSTRYGTVPTGPRERVLVLGRDEALIRQVSRASTRVLATVRRTAEIEHLPTAALLLDAFAREPSGIVIVDEDALEINATDLLRTLRELDRGWQASVLLMSRAFHEARVKLVPFGVRDVLPKPVAVQMLSAALERIVARRSAPDVG